MRTTKYPGMANACAHILIAALALLSCLAALAGGALAESDGMVRVKLARLGSPQSIEMVADCDYYLAADPSQRFPAGTRLTLTAKDGVLTLSAGNRAAAALGSMTQLMRATPGSSGMQFLSPSLSGRFCGDLGFSANGDVITTVLRVYVEDYLCGVVGYEMAPTSGLEALKAQAIVARNYALRQKAARVDAAYDLIDSGDALSYRGYNSAAEYADVLRAVDATRGQALFYDGSPATCYFCDSNGGQIESAANVTGEALPYSSLRDDPYDDEGSGAKKTASLRKDAAELAPELEKALLEAAAAQLADQGVTAEIHIDAIEAIAPGKARYAEPSRLYASLTFTLALTGKTVSGEAVAARVQAEIPTYGGLEDWYDLSINDEDNETVSVRETDRSFEITFRRNGSGLGMSRRGAQVMAKKGFTCAQILEYYYPGCEIRTLELADATRDEHNAPEAAGLSGAKPIANARLSQKTRLYANADESVAAITTLPAGAAVEIYAVQGDWAALGGGGAYGFAHTDALTDFELIGVTAAQVKDEALARVGAAVDVLQLPVDGAKALDHLESGDTVRLTAYTDAWAQVATPSGAEGFIPRDALTLQANGDGDGEIVTAPEGQLALLTEDAGLYVNADDTVPPRQALAAGDYVQPLAYNRAWAYVRTRDGETGYVKLNSLSAVESEPEPTSEPEPEPKPDESVVRVEGEVYRYVRADALPMFAEPASDSPVLATLSAGEKVRLGAYNDEWACVRVDGLTGFVLLDGLTDEAPPAQSAEIEGGEVTVVEGEQFATVIRDGAALYPSWDDSLEPLTLLKQNERVQLGAYNRRWACVRVDGVTGFMPIECLELNAADVPELDEGVSYLECEAEATVRLELYPNADLTGDVLAELNKGARLHVYAFNRKIAYVEYNGARGFVALRYLNKVD